MRAAASVVGDCCRCEPWQLEYIMRVIFNLQCAYSVSIFLCAFCVLYGLKMKTELNKSDFL